VYGAYKVAGLLVDEIVRQVPALKKYVRHFDMVVSDDGKGNYMSLQEAVDDAPVGHKTIIRILHGEWTYPSIPKNKKIKFSVSENARLNK
jgi:pectinesterase